MCQARLQRGASILLRSGCSPCLGAFLCWVCFDALCGAFMGLFILKISNEESTAVWVSRAVLENIKLLNSFPPPTPSFLPLCSESSSTISSNQSQESGYQSGTIQTATFTSQNSAQGPLYEQRSTQTRRYPNSISSSPQKDLTQAKVGK